MELNSMSSPLYTEEEIQEMQQSLLETPIDPAYNDICESFYDDWDRTVILQMYSRECYSILKRLDRLPPNID